MKKKELDKETKSLMRLMLFDLVVDDERWEGFNLDGKFSKEQRLKIKDKMLPKGKPYMIIKGSRIK